MNPAGELEQRIAALSPEKRRLLELIRGQRETDGGPFSLVSEEDRRKLPGELEDAYPLAMLQMGMIYHMEMTLDAPVPAYHNVNSFHVEAPFEPVAMQRAVDEVVARHPTLRTSFHLEGYGEPLQLVHREVALPIEIEDLRELPRAEQRQLLARFFAEENRRLFDLTRPPLLRIRIHLRTATRFQFTLTEPHVVSEGWSTTSTLAEICARFLARVEGRPLPAAPPPPVPYRVFVGLERQALRSPASQEFWRRQLEGATATRLARWPAGFRPSARAGNRKPSFQVSAGVLAGLRRTAQAAAVPLKNVALAAHLKVMSLWSGEPEVVTGLEFHGRPEERGGEDVRGVFINTLPLRMRLESCSWLDLVRRVFDLETQILPHRRYPLGALVRGREQAPPFEVSFTYLNFHGVDWVFNSGRLTLYDSDTSDLSVSNFPLAVTFHMAEGDSKVLSVLLEYDDQEFPLAQISAIQSSYQSVLAAMADDPSRRHDELPLLAERPRHQLLLEANDVPAAESGAGGEPRVHQLFERQAARQPAMIAVEHGGEVYGYGEVNRRANLLAHRLRQLGVGPDSRVGVCVERSRDLPVALLAVLKAGGAYLPLDPSYPGPRLAFLLADARVAVVVTQRRLAKRLPAGAVHLVLADEVPAAGGGAAELDPPPVGCPDHLAYMIYTSGSSGRPKGVMVSHRNLAASTQARAALYGDAAGARFLLLSSVAFDSSVAGIFWTLAGGGTLVLPDQDEERDPERVSELVLERQVSHLLALPSLYSLVLEREGGLPATALRVAIVAGEVCPPELPARHAQLLPGAALYNEYGPTEVTVWCSVHDTAAPRRGERVAIGRPIAGTRLYVVDPLGQLAPPTAPGELWIGGRGVARGYFGRPELTAERFTPDPWSGEPGARLYRSGDLVRWLPDGTQEFLGRRDRQIKLRGYRIELEEVETVLGEHPALLQAVAMVRQDGPGEPRLVAYVVPAGEAPPVAGELRGFLRQRLPEHMVPVAFVTLEAVPLTPNGKVDRAALPAPGAGRPELEAEYAAPRDEVERQLAAIWQEILGVERVGIYDNFFELGGSSLLLVKTHRRQRQALGLAASLADFFRNPTIAALAEPMGSGPSEPSLADGGEERAARRKSATDQRARTRELRRTSTRR